MAKKTKKRQQPRRSPKLKSGPTMPFRDAMALVPDDLPDGAYWAITHEMAGLDYGDGFDELTDEGE
jgi:hypothetical protein